MAAAAFLGARQNAVTDPERTFPPLLHHTQTRRRTGSLPMFGDSPDGAAINCRDAQHGHPG